MNKQQHTPGPWELNPRESKITANGEYVTHVCSSRYVDQRTDPEAEANARLIAAAPDLLALLVRALPAVRTWAGMVRRSNGTHSAKSADADNLVHEIRAALAKVTP